jgi:hypothetical protein
LRSSRGGGDDNLQGGPGDDEKIGFGGVDTIGGGPGDDTAFGGPLDDSIDGGPDHDTLWVNFGSDTITGGPGDDFIDGDNPFPAVPYAGAGATGQCQCGAFRAMKLAKPMKPKNSSRSARRRASAFSDAHRSGPTRPDDTSVSAPRSTSVSM